MPFKTLDVFRGFAAIWVVMDHSCDRWLSNGNLSYLNVPLYAFSIRGQLGVMLFFVISGYCITAAAWSALVSQKSIWRYSYERMRRIYPPYLFALGLTALATSAINFANDHHLIGPVHHLQTYPATPKFWIANLLLIQTELDTPLVNVVFWSLCYEVAFYFVIGLLLKLSQSISRRNRYQGTLFFVFSLSITTIIALASLIKCRRAAFPFDLWPQFAVGGLLFFLLEFRRETVKDYSNALRIMIWVNVAAVATLMVVFAVSQPVEVVGIDQLSSQIRCWASLLFCLVLIALRPIDARLSEHWLFRPIVWIGGFSYSLYLTHPIILPFVDILARKAGLTDTEYWMTFWLQVGVAIVFGRLTYLLVERNFISKGQRQRLVVEHVA